MSKQSSFGSSTSSIGPNLNMTQPVNLSNKRKTHTKLPNKISSLIGHRRVLKQIKLPSSSPLQVSAQKPFHRHSNSEVCLNRSKIISSSSPSKNYFEMSKAFSKFIETQPSHQHFLRKVQSSYEDYILFLQEKPLVTKDTREDSLEAAQAEIRKLRSREKQYKKLIKSLQKEAMPKIQVPGHSVNFQDEFMAHYSEFSESWRRMIDKH